MEKTVLIPTDLTIESLNPVSYAIRNNSGSVLNIILLHGFRNSDSIIDLLFKDADSERDLLVSRDFKNAFEILRNRNESQVKSIRVEFYGGYTRAALSNYVVANQVHEIYLPKEYKLKNLHSRSFDITPLLRELKVPIFNVAWPIQAHLPEKNLSAELFLYESK